MVKENSLFHFRGETWLVPLRGCKDWCPTKGHGLLDKRGYHAWISSSLGPNTKKHLLLFSCHILILSWCKKQQWKSYIKWKFLRIARLIYEELKTLPNKISFFDHWGDAAPLYTLPEVSPLLHLIEISQMISICHLISKLYGHLQSLLEHELEIISPYTTIQCWTRWPKAVNILIYKISSTG